MRSISATGICTLATLACLVFADSVTAQTPHTNALDSYRTAYDAATARITTDTRKHKDEAVAQYGKNLDAILKTLKLKGDIDGYAAVEVEAKRFAADKTILPNASQPQVASAVSAYQKQVAAADADAVRRQTALLNQYIAALNALVRDLMAKDKIADAKTAGEARKAAAAELAELASGYQQQPIEAPAAPPVEPAETQPPKVTPPAVPATTTAVPASVPAAVPTGLRSGLVLHYSFDQDEGGSVTDKSGRRNNGSASGVQHSQEGKGGGCAVFDGQAYIETPASTTLSRQRDFTWALWIKSTQLKDVHVLVDQGVAPRFYVANRKVKVVMGGEEKEAPTDLTEGEWMFVVLVQHDVARYVYINGREDARFTIARVNNVNAVLQIGCNINRNQKYFGLMDDVMVYDRALSGEEVMQLHELSSAAFREPKTETVKEGQRPATLVTDMKAQESPAVTGPDGTLVYGGHRYKYFDKIRITYPQTLEACQALGGHPVTLNTSTEWGWVKRTFLEGDRDKEFRTIYMGIELQERQWWTDADVAWVDGQRFGRTSVDWAKGHPWDHRDATGYRFRWIINFKGQWASVGPSNESVNGYICEWDGLQAGPPTPSNAGSAHQPVSSSQSAAPSAVEPAGSRVYLCDLAEVRHTGCTPYGLIKGETRDNWDINGETPRHILFAHAPSSIIYDISNAKMSHLVGWVGIGRVTAYSSVKFRIYGDSRLLWESDAIKQVDGTRRSMTAQFSVAIAGVKELKLETDCLGDPRADHSIWIEPRLTRSR